MPPKVDQFLRRRETTLLQIKAIETYANNLTDTEDVENVKARLETLPRLMTAFTDAEDEIFAKDAETKSEAVECDEIYYKTIGKLNTYLKAKQPTIPTFDITTNPNNSTLNQSRCDIKLPRLTLPIFDGNYQEWQSFHDMFVSTVHDNPGLTGVQKLQYLKDSLRGEARASLKHLAITEANYVEAYQKLTKSQPSVNQATGKQIRQICDTSDEVIRGIKALGNAGNGRDPWLIYLILNKMDEDTQQRWANETTEIDFPTWQSFLDFLTKRADSLENCQPPPRKPQFRSTTIHSHTVAVKNCPLCNTVHNLYQCAKFREMDVTARREFMQGANRCFNCLCDTHLVSRCQSKRSCMKCHKRHNTLLHLPANHATTNHVTTNHTKTEANIETAPTNNVEKTSVYLTPSTTVQTYQSQPPRFNAGLLQTALVDIRGANNVLYSCRALLDSGSLASFITESCVQKLGLPRKNQRTIVEGLGSTKVGTSRGRLNIEIFSRTRKNTSFHVDSLVLSSITSLQPQIRIPDYHWAEFRNLPLADPTFQEPGEIEILIGCDHYLSLLLPGHIKGIKSNLIAQETILGWIISGSLVSKQSPQITNLCTSINIDEALTKFWEIEQIKTPTPHTPEEIYCENHFLNNYKQNSDGRYIVALPFDPKAAPLGESKSQAARRLQSIERKFERDPDLKREYIAFMTEYQKLGHMERIPDTEIDIPWDQSYYLPHHSVTKETSTTTRVRVVFDASAKTKTGRSLNDNLCVGPSIQQTLQQLLLRFRFHRFVMTADLEKMFRQILITNQHTNFQRILWREDSSEPIQEFRLLTVTYGTSPAPFLSTRVLKQIANDNQEKFPNAAAIIGRDFYVDDLMTGADTLDQLITLKNEISHIMKSAGFNLRKWLSNCLPEDETSTKGNKSIDNDREAHHSRVLGIIWNTNSDYFTYKVALKDVPVYTKRELLSEASKLFDPQGWLAPITIYVKIIFQRTWAKGLEWDDPLPQDILDDWSNFRNQLPLIESITIPRWLKFTTSNQINLLGFSDASKSAYAAVIYAACTNKDGIMEVTIVSAKTKVAPAQRQISIPKLELCAALLLARIVTFSFFLSIGIKLTPVTFKLGENHIFRNLNRSTSLRGGKSNC